MTSTKRRGRPLGTGINDTSILEKIADLIAINPKLKPTSAMRRIDPRASEAQVRRLQVKWKLEGARFLSQARARVEETSDRAVRAQRQELQAMLNRQIGAAGEALSRYQHLGSVFSGLDHTTKATLAGPDGEGIAKALRDLVGSGTFGFSGFIGDHPALRASPNDLASVCERLSKQLKQADLSAKVAEKILKSSGKWPLD